MGDPASNPTNPAPGNPAPANPAPAPADPTTPPTPPASPGPADPANPTQPNQPDDGKGGKDAILADLARERDKRQTLEQTVSEMQTAQQAQMDAIAKALGLKEDTPPDPEALTAQVQAEQAKAREAAVQLAIYRNAAAAEANPDLLLDSASFLRSIADVDPADQAAVAAAIKAAVDANPLFKAAPAASATPPFPGGPRTPAAPSRAGTLGQAIAQKIAAGNNR